VPDVLIACEAAADKRVAKGFAEKVLLETVVWFADLIPEARPTWGGVDTDEYLRWASIGEVYKSLEGKDKLIKPVLGRFSGEQMPQLEAKNALKVMRIAEVCRTKAAVLMRDVDSHHAKDLRAGLEQGVMEYQKTRLNTLQPVTAIFALPDRYQEAWLLAGFEPQNNREAQKLKQIKKVLKGVDPIRHPESLNEDESKPRCAKTIWKRLSDNDLARVEACWEKTALQVLYTNGTGCGLLAYLEDIKTHLVTKF
jgi:hypothetical protein